MRKNRILKIIYNYLIYYIPLNDFTPIRAFMASCIFPIGDLGAKRLFGVGSKSGDKKVIKKEGKKGFFSKLFS